MAHDPLSRVASWIIPASADVTDKPPLTFDEGERQIRDEIRRLRQRAARARDDDPALKLLAERKRLDELAKRAYDEAIKLEATLLAHIRRGWVPVTFDARLWPGGNGMPSYFESEDLICLNFSLRAERGDVDLEYLAEQRAKALEQFRAGKAKIQEAREASGCTALFDEHEEICNRADEIDNQIWQTEATTLAGLLGQIDLLRDALVEDESRGVEMLDAIVAGIKGQAAYHLREASETADPVIDLGGEIGLDLLEPALDCGGVDESLTNLAIASLRDRLREASPISPGGDDQILARFREWVAARRHMSTVPDEEFEAACAVTNGIEDTINETPSSGAAGLAIKSYLSLHIESYRVADDQAALGKAINYEVHASILKDAVRFVPELASLAAHALAAHVAVSDHQVETPVIGFGDPAEGGAA